LFGHERGAFTDAKTERTGLLEAANEGTLFLDEIGEMPIELQSKLAVTLEKKTFRRVGGTRERQMDARIIAATNVNLLDAIREGRFRQDLYYRLNVFAIELPPLRQRGRDVVELAESFVETFARKYRKPAPVLNESARAALLVYPWPGNVRELLHVLERAVLLSRADEIGPLDLGLSPQSADTAPASLPSGPANTPAPPEKANGHLDLTNPGVTLDSVERSLIEEALRLSKGNISRAARLLGIGRGSLRRKLERHRITMYVDFGAAGEESRA
jgi:DNA-binding NtrC family response regulator